jgi:glycine C-acetyltransferase
MADIFERLVKNYGPIGQHRERAHGYFAFPKLEGEIGSRMKFRGKDVIVWSLNNYLGLANHPEVRKGRYRGHEGIRPGFANGCPYDEWQF